MPISELDAALSAFVRKGEIVVSHVRFAASPVKSLGAPRRMAEEEIRSLWARLRRAVRHL
jgi:hypothetical protein